jgi:hypothetical protein
MNNNEHRIKTFFEKTDSILIELILFTNTQYEKYMEEYKSIKGRPLGDKLLK